VNIKFAGVLVVNYSVGKLFHSYTISSPIITIKMAHRGHEGGREGGFHEGGREGGFREGGRVEIREGGFREGGRVEFHEGGFHEQRAEFHPIGFFPGQTEIVQRPIVYRGLEAYPNFYEGRMFRRCTFFPAYNILRRAALIRPIGSRVCVSLAYATALTEVMIIYDANIGIFRLAHDLDPPPCMNAHVVVELPQYVEMAFQDPYNPAQVRMYYADSYCSSCGQYFFIQP